jgi:hypothetical protein
VEELFKTTVIMPTTNNIPYQMFLSTETFKRVLVLVIEPVLKNPKLTTIGLSGLIFYNRKNIHQLISTIIEFIKKNNP